MKFLTAIWLHTFKLFQIFMCNYHASIQLSPYCDLICKGFEVSYIPAETLGEISLLNNKRDSNDY